MIYNQSMKLFALMARLQAVIWIPCLPSLDIPMEPT